MALRLLLAQFLPVLFLTTLPAFAGDSWDKVKDLPSGSDLKIYERGSAQPKIAKYADLTESSLIVIVKKEQVAIPKSGIDLIEARPPAKKGGGRRVVSETHMDDPAKPSTDGPHGPVARPQLGTPGAPQYSSSGGIMFGDDRESSVVYRRSSGAPAQKSNSGTEPRQ